MRRHWKRQQNLHNFDWLRNFRTLPLKPYMFFFLDVIYRLINFTYYITCDVHPRPVVLVADIQQMLSSTHLVQAPRCCVSTPLSQQHNLQQP